MKKYSKIMVALGMMLVMILCDVCLWGSVSVEAAGLNKKWKNAYMKIIKQCNKENSKARRDHSSSVIPFVPYSYNLIYFNNDNIPELVVGRNGYWVSMYTYDKKDNKVHTVIDQWAYGAMGNAGYAYIAKKNFLYNRNSDYAGAIVYISCMKMKNNKMVSYYPKQLKYLAFKDKNKNGVPDNGESYTSSYTYYYGNKKISKKKFNSYIKSGKSKMIKGNMSYKTINSRLSK